MCPSQLVTHTTNPTHHQKPEKTPPDPHPPEDDQKTSRAKKPITDDEPDVAVHTTHYKDARVHYPDLKQQPHTRTTHPTADQLEPGTEAPNTPPPPQNTAQHSAQKGRRV